jgi:hypothetical protein
MLHKKQPYFQEWQLATNTLAYNFAKKYFGIIQIPEWVADEIGGVCCISDYFFNVNDMADFLRYEYTRKAMFEYYEYALDCYENHNAKLNIKSWRHLKK